MPATSYEKALAALSEYLQEVKGPERTRRMQSAQLHLYRSGKISFEQYLDSRMSVCLARLSKVLDDAEARYVRERWREYVSRQLQPSGLFFPLQEALLNETQMGDKKERGDLVNQKGNAAEANNQQGSEDLNAMKRGEITLDEYIERRMELALANNPVVQLLPEAKRLEAREIMREHFLEDPVIRHYANIAAGNPSED